MYRTQNKNKLWNYITSLYCTLITDLKWWRNIEILINWERHLVVDVVYKLVPLGAYCSHGIIHGDLMVAVTSKHSPCVMCRLWVYKEITCSSAYMIYWVKLRTLFVAANESCYKAKIFLLLFWICAESDELSLGNYLSLAMAEVTSQSV